MSLVSAFALESWRERPWLARSCSLRMREVRFLTALRTRSEKYQQRHQHGVAVAEHISEYCEDHVHRSNPEVDHAVHNEIADAHPAPCQRKADLGQILIPDTGVEIRHQELDDREHADR